MQNKTLKGLALFLLLACLFTSLEPAQAQTPTPETVYREDFEDGQAQGWTLEPGWEIVQEDGDHVLLGQEHTWARASQFFDDYRLKFRLKVLRGAINIVFRLNNTGRYFINFQSNGAYLNKQYWPDTFFENLATSRRRHDGGWHEVEITGQAGKLVLDVDGRTEWTYTDPEPLLEGGFAFESLENTQVYVDDTSVELEPTSAYIAVPGTVSATSLKWVRTGGPLGGLGYDVRMRYDNPDVMFVTDAYAGVFTSTDSGSNWTPSSEGITVRTGPTGDGIPIFCLTIDPTDPDVIWAGTQNTRGIFKSSDGGKTWMERDKGIKENQGITFRGISVDPTNHDILYAAAELSSSIWNHGQYKAGNEFEMVGGVIYKTTDGGLTWKESWRGDNLVRYIWIDPRDTNVLYVSTGIFDREAANSDPQKGIPGGEGVLKSTDGGKTWIHVNNGLKNLYVGTLFMHPQNPDILLAGTGNNQYPTGNGIYLTTDGGANWKQVASGHNIEAVEFATSNPSIAYAGSAETIQRSEDGGATWKLVSDIEENGWGAPGVRAGFPIDFQVDPRNPDRIFANEYGGGNFLSVDGGKTWVDASRGYTGAQVRALAVDPQEPGRVIAAARSGIFVSNDGGSNWAGLAYPPVMSMEWNAIAIDPNDPQHFVAETNWGNFLVNSSNGGREWDRTFTFNEQRAAWRVVAFAPSDPQTVYAGSAGYFSAGSFDTTQPGKGIYVSHDGGKSWTAANDGLSGDAHVQSLAVDPQDGKVIYAATANHGLLKTTDGGNSWQVLQGGLPGDSASAVAINPANPKMVFAGFDRKSFFISTDGGATWKRSVSGMIAEARFTSIVFSPADPYNTVYAADAFSGIYRSINGGKNWAVINSGLTTRAINALAISSDGLHLYAASEGGGVFRLDINGQPPAAAHTPIPNPSATPQPSSSATAVPPPVTPENEPGGLPCTGTIILPIVLILLTWFSRRRS